MPIAALADDLDQAAAPAQVDVLALLPRNLWLVVSLVLVLLLIIIGALFTPSVHTYIAFSKLNEVSSTSLCSSGFSTQSLCPVLI